MIQQTNKYDTTSSNSQNEATGINPRFKTMERQALQTFEKTNN